MSSGEIVIGGVYGINRFFSDKIKYNEVLPNVFFTHFLLFNKEVEVGEVYGDKVILDKALNFVDQVELDYKQNMFCVQFASDNYIIPEKWNMPISWKDSVMNGLRLRQERRFIPIYFPVLIY